MPFDSLKEAGKRKECSACEISHQISKVPFFVFVFLFRVTQPQAVAAVFIFLALRKTLKVTDRKIFKNFYFETQSRCLVISGLGDG